MWSNVLLFSLFLLVLFTLLCCFGFSCSHCHPSCNSFCFNCSIVVPKLNLTTNDSNELFIIIFVTSETGKTVNKKCKNKANEDKAMSNDRLFQMI